MPLTKLNSASVIERLPVGSVLQTKKTQYIDTTSVSCSATTNTEINFLTVNITPKSTSSIIKLDAHIFHEWSQQGTATDSVWFFYRDSTKLAHAQAGSRECGISMSTLSYGSAEADSTPEIAYYSYFDAPNTTSQITYKVGVLARLAKTLYFNRTVGDADTNEYERGISFISAQEIKD